MLVRLPSNRQAVAFNEKGLTMESNGTIRTIFGRIIGSHLFKAEWTKLGGGHLQATIEGIGARVVVVTAFAYHNSDTFSDWFDNVVVAVTGG